MVHLFREIHGINRGAAFAHQNGRAARVGVTWKRGHLHIIVCRTVVLIANDFAVGGKQNVCLGQKKSAVGGDFLQSRVGGIGETLPNDTEHQSAEVEGFVGVVVEFHIVNARRYGVEKDFINQDFALGNLVGDAELDARVGLDGVANAVGHTINN